MENSMKHLLAALPMLAAAGLAQADNDCGTVTIADMNWNSATLIANVDRFILEHGYGCDAELIPGDTVPTGTSIIEKGKPDVVPELWTNAIKDAIEKGVAENRLRIAGKAFADGGEEGFWVPKYLVDQDPSLATIEGIKANAKLFENPEDPDTSAFIGCPAGWTCQLTAGHNFEALKLAEAGFELVDPGSSAGLSGTIARAYERQQPWFGYYWAPTAVLGKYDMVKVDFGTGVDEAYFLSCTTQETCPPTQATMWPPLPVHTVTTADFASKAPQAYEYLSMRSFTNDQMNQLLAWMEENQADGDIAMEHFLTQYESIWSAWVSESVVAKVKQALAQL